MDNWTSITLAVLTSLIASFVWYTGTSLYDFQSRSKIAYLLEIALDTSRHFENALEYNDYDIAVLQADRVHDLILQIHNNIKLLTYSPNTRRLIHTYLSSSFDFFSRFKNTMLGHEIEDEKTARCERFKRYLFNNNVRTVAGNSFITLQLEIIQALNSANWVCPTREILTKKVYVIKPSDISLKEIYKDVVDVKSFKLESGFNYHVRSFAFTQNEYYKFLDKHL